MHKQKGFTAIALIAGLVVIIVLFVSLLSNVVSRGCNEDKRGQAFDLGVRQNYGQRSGRQGRHPAGASPAVPIARFRHVAIPRLMGEKLRTGGC